MPIFKISRRTLLIGASGTAAVVGVTGLWLGIDKLKTLRYRNAVDRKTAFAPSAYLAVRPDGQVVVWITRSEMGQGISTALPMLIAEEMDADWSDVTIEQAVVGPEVDYGKHFTAASSSVTGEWVMFRRAGAVARSMLVDAAAEIWGVPANECTARKSIVYHTPTNAQATFAELADRAAHQFAPLRPTLKQPSEFNLIGTSQPRLDTPSKVTGVATYGLDVSLPNMAYAVIARPPALQSTLVSVEDHATRRVPGVVSVVEVSSGVAVVADSTYSALQGKEALKCIWSTPNTTTVSNVDIKTALNEALDEADAKATDTISEAARSEATSNPPEEHTSVDYFLPYLAHVCMEPMNCTAHVHDGKCEIWVPTQAPERAREVAARVVGLPISNVSVNVTQLGGGFGRRAGQDFVMEAVELASKLSMPVQVIWTRKDDITSASYREASAHRIQATFDPITKLPKTWVHRIACAQQQPVNEGVVSDLATVGASNLPYTFDHLKVEWRGVSLPIPTTIWRSIGYSYNTFVVETFLSEMAYAAGADSVEYRINLLKTNPRLKHCLEKVRDLANWDSSNKHQGVATFNFGRTQVAVIVEITGSSIEDFKMTKAWCVVDCGIAVNPDSVKAQIEGGMVDGLSAALYGGLNIQDNAIQQSNFHDYQLLRINETPLIQVEIIPSLESPSGIGEAGLPGAAPALANALFSLTGERTRRLPIKGKLS